MRRACLWLLGLLVLVPGCEPATSHSRPLSAQEALSPGDLVGLIERISEEGGYFDTDNLISNETGYLNVLDALERTGASGGAYIGVGPDQNYSYVAALRPEIVFISDVRRDNQLHHLLLKALIERAPTRIEFLAALHGLEPPVEPAAWTDRSVDDIVAWVDSASVQRGVLDGAAAGVALARVGEEVERTIGAYGLGLSADDFETIHRFHRTFAAAGMSLRFTTFGRPPRPYYPTYRQLTLETDADGDQASYLASADRYAVVRELHLANRIIPVVGDLAGAHALREIGRVLEELGVPLTGVYASNVEFYLWQARTFERWLDNLAALPGAEDAVLIRSYFPNAGGGHPSAIPGYYATQSLQPVAVLLRGGFSSYRDVVTRDVLPLR